MKIRRTICLLLTMMMAFSIAFPTAIFADDMLVEDGYDDAESVGDELIVEDEPYFEYEDTFTEDTVFYDDEVQFEEELTEEPIVEELVQNTVEEEVLGDNEVNEDENTSGEENISADEEQEEVFLTDEVALFAAADVTAELTVDGEGQTVSVPMGQKVAFSVKTNFEIASYQWYYKNANKTDFTATVTTPTYSVAMDKTRIGREVYCVVMDKNGVTYTTEIATMNLPAADFAITEQPQNQNVVIGETATFSIKTNEENVTYQWYYKNANKETFTATVTTPTYSVKMDNSRIGREVYCVVTNKDGVSLTSDIATMNLPAADFAITEQPQNQNVVIGETATFSIKTNDENVTYQWYYKNANKETFTATVTTPTYSVKMDNSRIGREVYCVVTNKDGVSLTSDIATMNLPAADFAITEQPQNQNVVIGETATFSIKTNDENVTYQWYYKNANKETFTATVTTPTYSVKMDNSRIGREVYCVVTNKDGVSLTSDIATMSIPVVPEELEITEQPKDQSVAIGEEVEFSIKANNEIAAYQWYYKNANQETFTATVTTPTYKVKMDSSRDGRQVYCEITDVYGNKLTSNIATMTIASIVENNIEYSLKEGVLTVVGYAKDYTGADDTLVIPETVKNYTVTEIGVSAFEGNTNLVSVDLPDTITVIHAKAFKNCSNLREMK